MDSHSRETRRRSRRACSAKRSGTRSTSASETKAAGLKIREAARAARFTWDAAAMQYIGELYE